MADAARETPHAAVILDDYSATVVRFLDFHDPPTIIAPGDTLGDPGTYSQVIARTEGDLVRALGSAAAERAVPVARDPAGTPTVWSVAP